METTEKKVKTREKILELVATGGRATGEAAPLSLRSIAEAVGVSHVAVVGHLKRMERDGLIVREGDGKVRLAEKAA
jgi:DNA-binding transcriptional ArsR family regulator